MRSPDLLDTALGLAGGARMPLAIKIISQLFLFLLVAGMAGSCEPQLCLRQFRRPYGIIAGLSNCCYQVSSAVVSSDRQ